MQVLLINRSDTEGGAAKATFRLHQGLLKYREIQPTYLVGIKKSDETSIVTLNRKFIEIHAKAINYFDKLLLKPYKTKDTFSINWIPTRIHNYINKRNIDLVHIHWIGHGFMKIESLKKINVPIVWTLHDMWPFTGGCHTANDCIKYKRYCGACPLLNSNRKNDFSKRIFGRKIRSYSKINNLTVVALSKWLEGCARNSFLFKNLRIVHLPNGIDTNVYKPIDKMIARKILNIPIDRKIILYGAINAISDKNKGFNYLLSSLRNINNDNLYLTVFGSAEPPKKNRHSGKTHYFGKINDDFTLALIYSAADLTVVPSLQENLSCVIMESLSCGTPVVAFDVGGNPDLIDNKINGYLAKRNDIFDLAKGIQWILDDEKRYQKMSTNARKKVLDKYDINFVSKEYINLYKEILKSKY